MTAKLEKGFTIDLEEKAISESDDVITLEGYASTFGNVDHGGDVVCAGAFQKSLNEVGLPMLLWQHKMDEPPIGNVLDAKEDNKGLWFKAEIPKDQGDPLIRRIGSGLKRRAIKSMSIGYKTARSERRKSDGARMLRQLKLYEISLVNLPMNPLASIDRVKGFVPFQELPVVREAKSWDATAAMARIKERFGEDEDARTAFLFADNEKGFDPRLLIADVDEVGRLFVSPTACFKAAAALCGAQGALDLDEEQVEAIKSHLDRYYATLNLESPFTSLSADEFEALTEREREARLKSLGVSQSLAKKFAGQWDADRSPRRDGAATDLYNEFRSMTAEILGAVKSINPNP